MEDRGTRRGAGALTVAALVAAASLGLSARAAGSPGWAIPVATLSGATGSQFQPHVASDARGDTVVVWSDGSGNVFESDRPAGGPFSVAAQISVAGGQSFGSVAVDGSGLIYVFFVIGGGAAATSQPNVATKPVGGSTWTITPLAATSASDPPGSPLVGAVTPSGKAIAVWYQGHTAGNQLSKFEYSTKAAGSSTWSTKAEVAGSGDQGNSTSPSGPVLALDPAGDAALVFTRSDTGFFTRVVFGTTLAAGAAGWTTANEISEDVHTDELQSQPVLAIDANGIATAAWARNNNASNSIIQFATKTLAASSWPVAPSGNSITPGANDLSPLASNAGQPSIAAEPDSTTTVAWTQAGEALKERTRPEGAGSFNAATTLPTTLTSPSSPVLAAGEDGSILAMWSGHNGGGASVISSARRAAGASTFAGLPDLPGTGNSQPSIASDDQENVAAAWVDEASAGQWQNQAAGLVIGPPTISNLSFPTTATVGAPFSYGATVSDRWTTATSSWSFGDGTTGPLSATKTYSAAGVFAPTLTATDPFGNTASANASIVVSPAPASGGTTHVTPALTAVSQSAPTWREGNKLATFSRRKKPPIGTTFSFTLNEQARVTFAFTQLASGRKLKGRCVAQTNKNRRKPACRRAVTLATLAFSGHSGVNKVAFQGSISRSRKLGLGSYTLLITATDTAGQHSSTRSLRFTIVK